MLKRICRTGALCGILAATLALGVAAPAAADGSVNVYSYRQPYLIKPLLDAFTNETGIQVNVIFAKKGLEERIRIEGRNSPADLLLSTDIGRLDATKQMGITQSVESDVLHDSIPAKYRDPEGHWFGLTTRARVVYASRERVPQDAITYEELADPKWKGRICTRSGQHDYTIGLVASLIAHNGEEATRDWLKKVKNNLAVKPAGNDRAQVKNIFGGLCDISLGNTYYMGQMMTNEKEPEQKDWAASVHILFPNTEGRGTHVNMSGMVMAKNAPNRENAVRLMEFLASDEAQHIYAGVNYEYPVNPEVEPSDLVKSWGDFKADDLPLIEVAKYRKRASELVDEVAFDDGPGS
ncbi:iron(III) transport system substrate-binding protein [Rhodobium orientis]|uniref:Iron ABC transporter substrate-binding protein n=1 Tax=Rhodobium orientis TaxID=34017 RepID=A0A327JP73_9HYPH|nr:Fe(3+) ABC transporter substrate-binding protein [Rhodobium orientis]MBB4301998.1 iron(III) transport system substrate-binding protein [Rhodobium orientis]MBK5950235.1 iron ABC transporter substrate-binding protein [Rhodobium orientis]RAI27163.1 iron ABC transporter substrate-binding protein [Rhodobium orientis]